jgi:hypothetical protein
MPLGFNVWTLSFTWDGSGTNYALLYLLKNGNASIHGVNFPTKKGNWVLIDDIFIMKTDSDSVYVTELIFCGIIMMGVMTNFSKNGKWVAFPYSNVPELMSIKLRAQKEEHEPELDPDGNNGPAEAQN